MNEKSTQQELDKRCKLLSRKWHPDKYSVNLYLLKIFEFTIIIIIFFIRIKKKNWKPRKNLWKYKSLAIFCRNIGDQNLNKTKKKNN